MITLTLNSSFGGSSKYKIGSDKVVRNPIGRAANSDQIAELAKHHSNYITNEVIKATEEARDADIRAFLGVNSAENIGEAIKAHLKKQIKAQF